MTTGALPTFAGPQRVLFKEVLMRSIAVLLASAVLASCMAVPPAPTRTAEGERNYQLALEGKVPQAPLSCLPSYQSGDMRPIDESTIVFRQGRSRTWVNHMQAPCPGLGSGHYALVTRSFGGQGLCRGDIAQVVDTMSRIPVGSCVFGDFTPYVRPRA
jgi:hypothetical protein